MASNTYIRTLEDINRKKRTLNFQRNVSLLVFSKEETSKLGAFFPSWITPYYTQVSIGTHSGEELVNGRLFPQLISTCLKVNSLRLARIKLEVGSRTSSLFVNTPVSKKIEKLILSNVEFLGNQWSLLCKGVAVCDSLKNLHFAYTQMRLPSDFVILGQSLIHRTDALEKLILSWKIEQFEDQKDFLRNTYSLGKTFRDGGVKRLSVFSEGEISGLKLLFAGKVGRVSGRHRTINVFATLQRSPVDFVPDDAFSQNFRVLVR